MASIFADKVDGEFGGIWIHPQNFNPNHLLLEDKIIDWLESKAGTAAK